MAKLWCEWGTSFRFVYLFSSHSLILGILPSFGFVFNFLLRILGSLDIH